MMARLKLILFSLLFASQMFAAPIYYVKANASGTGDGTSWVNAFPSFLALQTAGLTRGAIYFVAGGATPFNENVSINKAESGTTWIYFVHANMASNSTDIGWSDTFTNQTVINGTLTVNNGAYIEWNGFYGSGTNSNYGFKISYQTNGANSLILLLANHAPFTISHTEIKGKGYGTQSNSVDGVNWNNATVDQKNLWLHHLWIHGVNRNPITVGGVVGTSYADYGALIEDCYMTDNGSTDPSIHSQGIQISFAGNSRYFIIRRNYMRNDDGTAFIALLGSLPPTDVASHKFYRIYNNIFFKDNNGLYQVTSPGVMYSHTTAKEATDILFANNTIYGIGDVTHVGSLAQVVLDSTNKTSNLYLNNLVATCYMSATNQGFGGAGSVEATNGYFNCSGAGIPVGTIGQVSGIYPLASPATEDFSLLSASPAVGAGMDLSAIFTDDFFGNPRGSRWDLGAIASSVPAPSAYRPVSSFRFRPFFQ